VNPLRLVSRLASKSNHRVNRHVAIIVRGGAVIATAYNHDHTHAEVAALNKLWPSERKGARVWSFRLTRSGNLAMAKPCANCHRYLQESGVRMVYYSNPQGDIISEKM
jgi:deoxycytidylate deaminase